MPVVTKCVTVHTVCAMLGEEGEDERDGSVGGGRARHATLGSEWGARVENTVIQNGGPCHPWTVHAGAVQASQYKTRGNIIIARAHELIQAFIVILNSYNTVRQYQ